MKTGVTLKELNRLFDFLKQSKVNGEMTVLITNDMCYVESMIYYARKYLENNELEGKDKE